MNAFIAIGTYSNKQTNEIAPIYNTLSLLQPKTHESKH